jgi:serine/threonine protein phosphatase 1
MCILAIGDVHGCARALAALLAAAAPSAEDRIVTLGDYVDRGPDSRGVLEILLGLHATGRLTALRGNHEQMLLDARLGGENFRLWLACGGNRTLASYGVAVPTLASLEDIPERHWNFIEEALVDSCESEGHFFVHANAYPELPLAEQPAYMLLWEKLLEPCDHVSGKVMVCGHTRQRNGLPRHLGTTICIDTGAHERNGWLTGLDVGSGRYWQANEGGQVRGGILREGG